MPQTNCTLCGSCSGVHRAHTHHKRPKPMCDHRPKLSIRYRRIGRLTLARTVQLCHCLFLLIVCISFVLCSAFTCLLFCLSLIRWETFGADEKWSLKEKKTKEEKKRNHSIVAAFLISDAIIYLCIYLCRSTEDWIRFNSISNRSFSYCYFDSIKFACELVFFHSIFQTEIGIENRRKEIPCFNFQLVLCSPMRSCANVILHFESKSEIYPQRETKIKSKKCEMNFNFGLLKSKSVYIYFIKMLRLHAMKLLYCSLKPVCRRRRRRCTSLIHE